MMSEQKVTVLIKDKSLTKLAGNPFGRELFNEQIQGRIDLNSPFIIEFPKEIDYLASSFIQGFFGEIYLTIGRDGMEKNFNIIAPAIPNVRKIVMERLSMM